MASKPMDVGAPRKGAATTLRARRSRQRGFSALEGLFASAIVAVAITAIFGLWAGMFRRNAQARFAAQAGQLARAEVERAKVYGMDKLPVGVYDPATDTATWTGSYNPGTNAWVSGAKCAFDQDGNRLASSSASNAALTVQAQIVDTNVLAQGSGYAFQLESRRAFLAIVTSVADGTELFRITTVITPGGL